MLFSGNNQRWCGVVGHNVKLLLSPMSGFFPIQHLPNAFTHFIPQQFVK